MPRWYFTLIVLVFPWSESRAVHADPNSNTVRPEASPSQPTPGRYMRQRLVGTPRRCSETSGLVSATVVTEFADTADAADDRWEEASRNQTTCSGPRDFAAFHCFNGGGAHWRGYRAAADIFFTTGDAWWAPGLEQISIPFNYLIQSPILLLNRATSNRMCQNLVASLEQLTGQGQLTQWGQGQLCAISCVVRAMRGLGWLERECEALDTRLRGQTYPAQAFYNRALNPNTRNNPNTCPNWAGNVTTLPPAPQSAPNQQVQPPTQAPVTAQHGPRCRCRCFAEDRSFNDPHRPVCRGVAANRTDCILSYGIPNSGNNCNTSNGGTCSGFRWVGRTAQPAPVANQPGFPFPAGWQQAQNGRLEQCAGDGQGRPYTSTSSNQVVMRPLSELGESE